MCSSVLEYSLFGLLFLGIVDSFLVSPHFLAVDGCENKFVHCDFRHQKGKTEQRRRDLLFDLLLQHL